MHRRISSRGAIAAIASAVACALSVPAGASANTACPAPSTGYGATVAGTAGVVSYWRLGETSGTSACDTAGANNGAYAGGYTLGVAGAIAGDPDTAVALNGSTGRVDVPHTSSLDVGDSFSIEAWVRRAVLGGSYQVIASQQAGSWMLAFNSSNKLVLRRATVADLVTSKTTVTDSAWHHVVATKNGSTVKLYIDGVDVTGTVTNSTMANNTQTLEIGRSSGGSYWNGSLDDIALYSRPLTATEVKTHFQQGTGTVTQPPPSGGDPVVAAAGDIACDPGDASYNGGLGTSTACHQKATSDLLIGTGLTGVLTLGDEQYDDGTLAKFKSVYDATWGRANQLGHPTPGNHEYLTTNAAGYFDYFDGVGTSTGPAGDRGKGYYSYDVGTWHMIALNSNCSAVSCATGSAQETWLKADLAAHPNACTVAYWHHPRYSSGIAGNTSGLSAFWNDLYNAKADLVLNGHDHDYERFAPQSPSGALDSANGIREFVVGTGGKSLKGFSTVKANSELRMTGTYGVLRLTLHPNGYDWQFAPEAGKTFSDSGTQACH